MKDYKGVNNMKIFIIIASILLAIFISHYKTINNMNQRFDEIDNIELNIRN